MPLARQRGHLLDAIGPVAAAAQQAHHHQPRAWRRSARHRGRPRGGGRAAAGWRGAGSARLRPARLRRRRAGELGVGRREHDDLARRLAEIDRLAAVSGVPGCARADASARASRPGAASTARGSRPLPITTSRRARLVGAPGPVEVVLDAVADALQDQAHRLAGHLEETLHPQDGGRRSRPCSRAATDRRLERRQREVKLSKSSWSWSSPLSWCEGRASRSSSAAAPRPSSTSAVDRAEAGRHDLHAWRARSRTRASTARQHRRHQVGLVEDDQSAAVSCSSNNSSSGLSWSSAGSAARCAATASGSSAKRPSRTAAARPPRPRRRPSPASAPPAS